MQRLLGANELKFNSPNSQTSLLARASRVFLSTYAGSKPIFTSFVISNLEAIGAANAEIESLSLTDSAEGGEAQGAFAPAKARGASLDLGLRAGG